MDFFNRLFVVLTEVHPLHPMIVHFPIALTGAAFLFILLAYWKNNVLLEQAAFANISLAAVSTIFAGITGYMDNIKNYEATRPMQAQRSSLQSCSCCLQRASASSATAIQICSKKVTAHYILVPMA